MKRNNTVIIYGSGPSLRTAIFPDSSDKWAVGTLFNLLGKRIDLYFCMHSDESVPVEFIDQNTYPLNEIIGKYGKKYFNNTIAYMIAYAIYLGYEGITLSGVDLSSDGEYTFERPCVAYWAGIAEGNGINVNWNKLESTFLYGYEEKEMKKVLKILKEHKEKAKAEFDASDDKRVKDQWTGYLFGVNQIINDIRK